jgi:8-oxo-dGTP pyrophosphatase MutT (NUDIX family)
MSSGLNSALRRGLTQLSLTGERNVLSIEGFHRAGVLVPLILSGRGADLLFTRRTDHVETHKGQISFPGGMSDKRDTDIVHTALREVEEELGIGAPLIDIRGILDDLAVPSGFIITPVVGILNALPPLNPNPQEVAEAFTVPFAFFCNPANGRSELRDFRGGKREVWFYQHGEHNIWGATAMIVRSLLLSLGVLGTTT